MRHRNCLSFHHRLESPLPRALARPGETMKIGIVTDSTCDLPQYFIEQHELEVIPSILVLDGKEYADGIELSLEDFYHRLPSLPPSASATTAAPSIGEF